jgi:hypothetical protein
MLISL